MAIRLIIGIDGSEASARALTHARQLAGWIGECELIVVYVIEWSPFSFQTPEENAERHKRREEEIETAHSRIVDPAVRQLGQEGFAARGIVRHGDVAELLDRVATDENAEQIIVARVSNQTLFERVFGSAMAKLVMHARVPVTVVG